MKKKLLAMTIAVFCAFIFCACDKKENEHMNENPNNNEQETVTIESLEGEWVGYIMGESQYKHTDEYTATINKDTILVIKKNHFDFDDSKGILWWYGSYVNPKEPVSEYEFISSGMTWVNGEDMTSFEGESKIFNYSDSKITIFLYHEDEPERDWFVVLEKKD